MNAPQPHGKPVVAFTKRFDELERDLDARCAKGAKSLDRLRQTTERPVGCAESDDCGCAQHERRRSKA